ncbi:hypothetical protein FPC831_1670002 [Flavobacterium psychrophilum]|nr:hypothetical protein FPC831_1670002 [Flavobacterium psychrophilum]
MLYYPVENANHKIFKGSKNCHRLLIKPNEYGGNTIENPFNEVPNFGKHKLVKGVVCHNYWLNDHIPNSFYKYSNVGKYCFCRFPNSK